MPANVQRAFRTSVPFQQRYRYLLAAILSIRALTRYRVFFKFADDVTDLETFFQVVVLVGVDKLKVLTAIEDDCAVLVVRFSVTKNGVTRHFDAELGPTTPSLGDEL